VEWLVETDGSGALVLAKYLVSQSQGGGSVVAVVDPLGECYLPAFTGWGLDARRLLVVHPETLQETSWGVEQCLRCEGIKATLAWVDRRIHERVHRRWQLAAEAGGGIGMFFRPVETRREPVWADLRLLVRPLVKGEGEIRRIHVEVLYRRGGLGGSAQVWEIDHAAGFVRLVPPVANSAQASRAPRSQTG
jgi:protein ImuA